jgi:OmpA-OmpF porin, OOP family
MRGVGASLIAFALAGCAGNQISVIPDEGSGIAVLDPASETEVSVVNQASNVIVSGKNVSVKALDPKAFDTRNAALLASLPPAPRPFTLYFKENSTEPDDASQAVLKEIFAEIRSRPGADIQITGHTDTVGAQDDNDALSLRRAAEITSYLFTVGLDKTIVRLAGRGERELKEQTADNVASAVNRRVEVIVR